jgi:hypothetical protein
VDDPLLSCKQPIPAGLQEGCTATMTAPRTASQYRPDQGGWLSWRPDSNRVRGAQYAPRTGQTRGG